MSSRRQFLALLGLSGLAGLLPDAWALTGSGFTPPVGGLLDPGQSDRFRAWMTLIIAEQFRTGPSPRWMHRDCAGLVRFAVAEALRPHDERWQKANGFDGRRLPPEVDLRPDQAALREGWSGLEGTKQAFVPALVLVQNNSRLLGKALALAKPGDLLFFDQGDEQHLMIWMGKWIAYHNGQTPITPPQRKGKSNNKLTFHDHGLRSVTPAELLQWKDTRWRLQDNNPNFVGFFRLAFLSR